MHQPRIPPCGPVARAAFGLPEVVPLYLCLQNPMKLHPDFDPLLQGILAADANGRIVLLAGPRSHAAGALRERFARKIPDGIKRVILLPWQKQGDYFRLLQTADVILDPPHYTAGSSAYDLFSFNLPVVTMLGSCAVGRVTTAF